MKTMKTLFAVIIGLFVTNAAIASGNLKVNLASNEAELTVVEISNANKISEFEIQLIDAYGEELYRMETKAPRSDLQKRYDLSELEDGVYWYTVKVDKETVTKKLAVEDGRVDVLDIRKSLEPYITKKDDKLMLTLLNYQEEDVKLYVYDSNNSLLAEADLGNDFTITKALDLEELRYGNYEVVIANDLDIFEHRFEVN